VEDVRAILRSPGWWILRIAGRVLTGYKDLSR